MPTKPTLYLAATLAMTAAVAIAAFPASASTPSANSLVKSGLGYAATHPSGAITTDTTLGQVTQLIDNHGNTSITITGSTPSPVGHEIRIVKNNIYAFFSAADLQAYSDQAPTKLTSDQIAADANKWLALGASTGSVSVARTAKGIYAQLIAQKASFSKSAPKTVNGNKVIPVTIKDDIASVTLYIAASRHRIVGLTEGGSDEALHYQKVDSVTVPADAQSAHYLNSPGFSNGPRYATTASAVVALVLP